MLATLFGAPQAASAAFSPLKETGREPFVRGELLVRFHPSVGHSRRAQALLDEGASRKRWLPVPGLELISLPGDVSVGAAVREFESKPEVMYAEPNYIYRKAELPNDTRFVAGEMWALNQVSDADIDAPEAWDLTQGSYDVLVAVVDTGIRYDHPDLAANIYTNPGEVPADGIDNDANGKVDDVRGWDFAGDGTTPDNDPMDIEGHGTHVAGTIGARGNNGLGVAGVNWNVKLLPVRVLGPEGGTNADVTAGFAYAALQGARVVNASLGGGGESLSMKAAIDAATNTLFVVAAGNDAADNEVVSTYPCNYTSANLVCVAATNRTDELADFSNYGTTSVDLGAPGTEIVSTWLPYEAVFSDGFEDPLAWTAGGTPNTWAATTAHKLDGAKSGTDSPAGPYADDSDNWFQTTNAINLTGREGCVADYQIMLQTEFLADGVLVEGSDDGVTWDSDPLDGLSGQTPDFPNAWFGIETPLGEDFDGVASFYLRFAFVSDEEADFDGVYLDRVRVKCLGATFDADDYFSIDGTSMATPHVAGVAALAWALEPTATVAHVRKALLEGGDALPSLDGKTVSGRRLNARGTLLALARRSLVVAKFGLGAGTVTSAPAGIDCGVACAAAFPDAATVTLAATPAPGSKFAGWFGDCSGTGPCQVTLTGVKLVGAQFDLLPAPPEHPTLSLAASPKAVTFGRATTLAGVLKLGSAPLAGQVVTLSGQPVGSPAFAPIPWATTDAAGRFRVTVKPAKRTTFKATFARVAADPTEVVRVRHLITLSATRGNGRMHFQGAVGPRHPGRVVSIQRKRAGRWVTVATVRTSRRSGFQGAVPAGPGSAHFRARIGADREHLANVSRVVRA